MIYDKVWYDMMYDMIHLTAIGLTPGGSSKSKSNPTTGLVAFGVSGRLRLQNF